MIKKFNLIIIHDYEIDSQNHFYLKTKIKNKSIFHKAKQQIHKIDYLYILFFYIQGGFELGLRNIEINVKINSVLI
jgi:hypothetical protein